MSSTLFINQLRPNLKFCLKVSVLSNTLIFFTRDYCIIVLQDSPLYQIRLKWYLNKRVHVTINDFIIDVRKIGPFVNHSNMMFVKNYYNMLSNIVTVTKIYIINH